MGSANLFVILIVALVLIVIAIVIVVLTVILINSKPFSIDEVNIDRKKWVRRQWNRFTYEYVEDQFSSMGKAIKTKKGEYRVDYSKAVSKFHKTAFMMFFDGNYDLSQSVKQYIGTNYKKLRRCDLNMMFSDYYNAVKNHQLNSIRESISCTPQEFFLMKESLKGDIVGVYDIWNRTDNMHYVGQAKRLVFRVNQHLTGHGNGDVYADYKYGKQFLIRLYSLAGSGYADIDQFEKMMIEKFDAFNTGYNRTRGNE